jgi:DNA-binding transcriptional MocR family regulator
LPKLYQQLAQQLSALIADGTLKPGARLPSIRQLCNERDLSPATAMRAYQLLESQSLIETRTRSGHYVSRQAGDRAAEPRTSRSTARSTRVAVSDLVFQILEASGQRDVIPLGSAFPAPTLFPWPKLARYLGSSARRMDPWSTVTSLPHGNLELRRQIAQRYLRQGCQVSVDDVVVTSGALEGLTLALQILTRPGDAVAIESPSFYGCLQAIEALGLQAIEIPTHPGEGVDLAALDQALGKHPIRACWFMTRLQNPSGATMPEAKVRDLVRLLEKRGVPLIEDDVYGELQFAPGSRPAKAFDRKGLVLHCGSFSKCLAPGYRVGWVAAGRFTESLRRRKITTTLGTSLPAQQAISVLLQEGGYEAHLSRLRAALQTQQAAALQSLQKHLGGRYRVALPQGGYFLWLELAQGVDALALYAQALDKGISIAPGPMFSPRRQYRNYLRLNYGHPWTAAFDRAVATLAKMIQRESRP